MTCLGCVLWGHSGLGSNGLVRGRAQQLPCQAKDPFEHQQLTLSAGTNRLHKTTNANMFI